jgi:hypothetical protein
MNFNCILSRRYECFACERNRRKTRNLKGHNILYFNSLSETSLEKKCPQSEHCEKTGFNAFTTFQSATPMKQQQEAALLLRFRN